MSVPKRRKTASKTRMGRSHQAMKPVQLSKCGNCSQPVKPHQVCPNCGTYKSRQVIRTQADKKAAQSAKKEAKEKEAAKSR